MPTLPAYERETTVNFNDADDFAIVTTHQRTVITSLRKNTAATELSTDSYGGVSFQIPKKLVTFRNPRKQSDASKAAVAERMRAARAAKGQ